MNLEFPHYPSEEKKTGSPPLGQSSEASQIPSSGGLIGKGINLYLGFIWLITTSWKGASFTDWKAVQDICNTLSQSLVNNIEKFTSEPIPPNKKAALHKYFEVHFEALSIHQLKSLETQFKEHPKMSILLITEALRQNPHILPTILRELATINESPVLKDLETTASILTPIKPEILFSLWQFLLNPTTSETTKSSFNVFLNAAKSKVFEKIEAAKLSTHPEFKNILELFSQKLVSIAPNLADIDKEVKP